MVTTSRNFAKLLISEIQAALTSIDLHKRSQNEFTMDLSPEVIGRVSFAVTNAGDDILSVNPGLAVRHQVLEKLVAELSEQEFHPYRPGTIGANIGYVTPEKTYLAFEFSPHEELGSGILKMIDVVKLHGYRWMEEHRTLTTILEEMLAGYRFILRDAARLRVPVIYYLQGDFSAAHDSLEKGLAEIGNSAGPASDQYRRLANALRPRLAK